MMGGLTKPYSGGEVSHEVSVGSLKALYKVLLAHLPQKLEVNVSLGPLLGLLCNFTADRSFVIKLKKAAY